MIQDNLLPIEWDEWDGDSDSMILYNVHLLEDFGPWKKGTKLESLSVDYVKGEISTHNDLGEEVMKIKVKLVPKS